MMRGSLKPFGDRRLGDRPRASTFVVVAWSILMSHCEVSEAASPARPPPRPTPPTGEERFSFRIVVLPAVTPVDTVVRLRVEAEPPLRSPLRVRWRADAGVIFFDDQVETDWRTPVREGTSTVRVAVTVTAGKGTVGVEERTYFRQRSISILRPSTERMVWIPEGPFIRGDVEGTENTKEVKTIQNSSDEPFHRVHLRGYWIDRYPVTNEAYVDYLEDALKQGMVRVTPRAVVGHFEGEWVPFYYFKSYEDLVWEYLETVNARVPGFLHLISWDPDRRGFTIRAGHEKAPVVDVSWFGAAAYAKFYGKRLPTEAQWEKAARGADTRKFPWGDELPTAYHVNVNHYRGDAPTPIGTFSPEGDSPYGVGDMVAGLFEWTRDWFNATYYEDLRAETPLRDPTGPFWGKAHAIRSFPSAVLFAGSAVDGARPVSSRYHWRFEFFVRDIFANRQTTFRTVVSPPPTGYEYDDDF